MDYTKIIKEKGLANFGDVIQNLGNISKELNFQKNPIELLIEMSETFNGEEYCLVKDRENNSYAFSPDFPQYVSYWDKNCVNIMNTEVVDFDRTAKTYMNRLVRDKHQ